MKRPIIRALVGMLAVGGIAAIPLGSASAGSRGPSTAAVSAVGGFEVEINDSFTTTFKFDDDSVSVRSGGTVTWTNRIGFDENHTITIAPASLLPGNLEQVFNCGPPGTACAPARDHFDANFNPIPGQEVLNAGPPGLDQPGDSLLLGANKGDTISSVVSAPPGTTLHYLCAIHPWMQGEIEVEGR